MSVPVVLSPEAAYCTKINILYPGTQTQATAAESRAQTRINDTLSEVSVTVSGGAIEIET